jgi:copper(I)-binding protein
MIAVLAAPGSMAQEFVTSSPADFAAASAVRNLKEGDHRVRPLPSEPLEGNVMTDLHPQPIYGFAPSPSARISEVRSARGRDPSVAMAAQCTSRALGRRVWFSMGVRPKRFEILSFLTIIVAWHCADCTDPATAQDESFVVSDAWVPAMDQVGRDVPLLMTIRNNTSSPDALMRVRCPIANFSERHAVDRGEGAPAMRPISSIPIAATSTVVLKPTEHHVMLLQTRQPLQVGERFNCSVVFQKAGTKETEVEVRKSP